MNPLILLLLSASEQNLSRVGAFSHELVEQGTAAAQQNGSMYLGLEPSCADHLIKIYSGEFDQNGAEPGYRTLFSHTIYQNTLPVDEMPTQEPVRDRWFHHWTNATPFIEAMHPEMGDRQEAHQKILAQNGYDRSFVYYRTKATTNFLLRVHYVAEDAVSSQMYGETDVAFELSQSARFLPEDSQLFFRAYPELEQNFPGFGAACGRSWQSIASVSYFILDDSLVDLAGYQGFTRWYQLISTRNIVGSMVQSKQQVARDR